MEARDLTEAEAIALAETRWWEGMEPRAVAEFQLFTRRLCMPFGEFHKVVEEALGRPAWTHEFAFPDLKAEFLGNQPAPTWEEIVGLLPADKAIVLETPP